MQIRSTLASVLAFTGLMASASHAVMQSISVSGFVGNIMGPALPNAGVKLSRAGLSTTTGNDGNWSIVGSADISSIRPRQGLKRTETRHLLVEQGRVRLDWSGRDIAGRDGTSSGESRTAFLGSLVSARALADSSVVDTILYSWNGAVVDKQPLWGWQRTGIKEYIDTIGSVAPVTPGPAGVSIPNAIPLGDFSKYTAQMAKIPARNRSFMMGLKDSIMDYDFVSRPLHKVSFSYDWYMDTTGVTVSEYAKVMNWALQNGDIEVRTSSTTGGRGIYTVSDSISPLATITSVGASSSRYLDFNAVTHQFAPAYSQNYPMIDATWFGAAAFANYKSSMAGLEPVYNPRTWKPDYSRNGYRLPTDAEWEYSARSGTTTLYYWGDSSAHMDRYAVTTGYWAVASAIPNNYGLYDMVGNGEDWCTDRGGLFSGAAQVDPVGPAFDGTDLDSTRISRGGGGDRIGVRSVTNIVGGANGLRLVLPIR